MSTQTAPLAFSVTEASRMPVAERDAILQSPGFGDHFTDHMVSIDWSISEGWHNAEVIPYGPLQLDPASSVLHYGQEIFEGLKAYRHADGSVWTFRPEENAKRLNESARRLALPELPVETFVEALRQLLAVDADWVPSGADSSLYIRPFMIANENFLGVRSAQKARFLIIASPAGPYFTGGVKPVSIWLSTEFSRAGHGGTGEAKCGGNYASSLLPQNEAAANGCQQVLFLDSRTEDTIDELGGMNLFLVADGGNTLITPALNGNILHGITRASLIQLAKNRGMAVEERQVTVSEWREGAASGRITEAFACGTAAVITPIGALKSPDFTVEMGAEPGSVTLSLRAELTGTQTGAVADTNGWMLQLTEAK